MDAVVDAAQLGPLSALSLCLQEKIHGSCLMANLLHKFIMKTSVFLLLLAAFTCGLAQGEEQAAEEVQVETLVSETPD